jgi:hypothetical protein
MCNIRNSFAHKKIIYGNYSSLSSSYTNPIKTNHIEWELGAIQYQSVPSWKKTTEGYKQGI